MVKENRLFCFFRSPAQHGTLVLGSSSTLSNMGQYTQRFVARTTRIKLSGFSSILTSLQFLQNKMASSFLQAPLLHKSSFFGHTSLTHKSCSFMLPKQTSSIQFSPAAKFNLFEILGGRGLCNGEAGLQEELKKTVSQEPSKSSTTKNEEKSQVSTIESVPEDGFEKELQGLTGGFPGGEKGLQKFIEQNPPPRKSQTGASANLGFNQSSEGGETATTANFVAGNDCHCQES